MSEDTTTFDDDLDGSSSEPPEIVQLRRQAKKAKELEAELASLRSDSESARRELAFAKAGINPDDPKFRYFAKGYEGDLDPEAIKAEAIASGFIADPTEPSPAENQALANVADATAGAEPDLSKLGSAGYHAELAAATSMEEVMAIASRHGSPIVQPQ